MILKGQKHKGSQEGQRPMAVTLFTQSMKGKETKVVCTHAKLAIGRITVCEE